jgi:hypothetical protein
MRMGIELRCGDVRVKVDIQVEGHLQEGWEGADGCIAVHISCDVLKTVPKVHHSPTCKVIPSARLHIVKQILRRQARMKP